MNKQLILEALQVGRAYMPGYLTGNREILEAAIAAVQAIPDAQDEAITLNRSQVLQLLQLFDDDEESEVQVTIQNCVGHSGMALYAWFDEYPEEGSIILDPATHSAAHPAPADAQDAKRYRWLRGQHWNDGTLAVVTRPRVSIKLGYDSPSRERLDAAIDAAMQSEKK